MSKPEFVGLAAEVKKVVEGMEDIISIACVRTRSSQGHSKVKIPLRWKEPRVLPIIVSDKDHGEREIEIRAYKAAAIARILHKRLAAKGVNVTTIGD
jgi:hypothetical protein